MTAVLSVRDLVTEFHTREGVLRAVQGVSFDLARGEVLGLVGESGSGKSVTGYSIMGLVDAPGRIASGSVRLHGEELVGAPEATLRRLRGRRIAMIFQDPMMTLNPVLSIETQMVETMLAHEDCGRARARERSLEVLGQVGIASPEERLRQYPHQFSGGMRQRVAIAIALLHRPDVIVADEPTTALDVTVQGQILHEMQRLVRDTGSALIWITHDLAVVAGLADRVAVMYAGRIVEEGDVDGVLEAPAHPYTRGLLESVPAHNPVGQRLRQIPGMAPSWKSLDAGCAFRSRCTFADTQCEAMPELLRRGRTWCALPSPLRGPGLSAPLLEFRSVSKRFERKLDLIEKLARRIGAKVEPRIVHAVDRVSLTVHDGEVVALVGESGCGKSTLGRLGAGLHRPTDGEVRYRGQALPQGAGQRPVQMIFQDPFASLNPRLRVGDAIAEAPLVHGLVDRAAAPELVAQSLKRVGLDAGLASRYPHQFSGGQRARIGIARALAVQPEFLVCDEAVAALDVSIQAQVLNLFMDLREQLGLTYLFISHDLGVVRHISERVVVMYLGRVVEVAPTDVLFSAPLHPYTQALLDEVPRLDRRHRSFVPIRGEIPSPLHPPSGCHFHPRCPKAMARCASEVPALVELATGRLAACHLHERSA